MTTVRCIQEAVVTTNRDGQVTYLSPAAETLTGWTLQELVELDLGVLLKAGKGAPFVTVDNPARRAMVERRVVRLGGLYLKKKDGAIDEIDGRAAPVSDDAGTILGSVVVFQEVKRTEPAWGDPAGLDRRLARPAGIINLCAWCKRVPDESGHWCDLETFISEHSSIQFNGGLCPECMVKCFPREVQSSEQCHDLEP
jgi:PAS domain S-box-containing protein